MTDIRKEVIETLASKTLDQLLLLGRKLEHDGGRTIFDRSRWAWSKDDGEIWYFAESAEDMLQKARKHGQAQTGVYIQPLTELKVDAERLIEDAIEGTGGIDEEFGGHSNHGLCTVSDAAVAELQAALDAAVFAWVLRHDIRAECARDILNVMTITAAAGDAAPEISSEGDA